MTSKHRTIEFKCDRVNLGLDRGNTLLMPVQKLNRINSRLDFGIYFVFTELSKSSVSFTTENLLLECHIEKQSGVILLLLGNPACGVAD